MENNFSSNHYNTIQTQKETGDITKIPYSAYENDAYYNQPTAEIRTISIKNKKIFFNANFLKISNAANDINFESPNANMDEEYDINQINYFAEHLNNLSFQAIEGMSNFNALKGKDLSCIWEMQRSESFGLSKAKKDINTLRIQKENEVQFLYGVEKTYIRNLNKNKQINNDGKNGTYSKDNISKDYKTQAKCKAYSTTKISDLSSCLNKFFKNQHDIAKDKKLQKASEPNENDQFTHKSKISKINKRNDNQSNQDTGNFILGSPKSKNPSVHYKILLSNENLKTLKVQNKKIINNPIYLNFNNSDNNNNDSDSLNAEKKEAVVCAVDAQSNTDTYSNLISNRKKPKNTLVIPPRAIKKDCSKNTLNIFENKSKNENEDVGSNTNNISFVSSVKELKSENESRKSLVANKALNSPKNRKSRKTLPDFCDLRESIKIAESNSLENFMDCDSNNNEIKYKSTKLNSTNNLLNFSLIEKLKKEEADTKSIKCDSNALEDFLAEFITIDNLIPKTIQAIRDMVLPQIRKNFGDPVDSRKLADIQTNARKIACDFRSFEKKNKIFNLISNIESDNLNHVLKKPLANKKLWNNPLVKQIMVYLNYKTQCEDDFYTSSEDEVSKRVNTDEDSESSSNREKNATIEINFSKKKSPKIMMIAVAVEVVLLLSRIPVIIGSLDLN